MTTPVLAAGTVLWRRDGDDVQVALVHRPKYDDWSLPKGKCEPGEHLAVTAIRETREEAGFDGVLGRYLGEVGYAVQGPDGSVPKIVSYWAMQALGGAFTPSSEVDRLEWMPVAAALTALTREHDQQPVRALLAAPLETAAVLLVRHAHAGSRKAWKGADEARPLNALGQREAVAIGAVATVFGPAAVGAADLLRCEQTVAPLAEAVGVAVEHWPALSERRHGRAAEEAADLVRSLATDGRPVAVCSQGGVIPDVLAALGGRKLRDAPARKGSVWVLSFAGSTLVAADYLRSLLPTRPG